MAPFDSPVHELRQQVDRIQTKIDALKFVDEPVEYHDAIRREQTPVARTLKRYITAAISGGIKHIDGPPAAGTPVENDPLNEQDIVRRQRVLDEMLETLQGLSRGE